MNIFVGKFKESLVQRICLFVYIGMNNVEFGLRLVKPHSWIIDKSPYFLLNQILKICSKSSPFLYKCFVSGFTIILKANLDTTMSVIN